MSDQTPEQMQRPFAEAEAQTPAAPSIAARMASPFRLLPIGISQLSNDELVAYSNAYRELVAQVKSSHATAGKNRRKRNKK
jgi:hypothetical protein